MGNKEGRVVNRIGRMTATIFWTLAAVLVVSQGLYPPAAHDWRMGINLVLLAGLILCMPLIAAATGREAWQHHSTSLILVTIFLVWVGLDLAVHGLSSHRWADVLALGGGVVLGATAWLAAGAGERRSRRLLAAVAILGGAMAVLGILQYLIPGIFLAPFSTRWAGRRILGAFSNPNQFGGLLVVALPVLAGWLGAWTVRRRTILRLAGAGVALTAVALVLVQSRGALLGVVAGGLVVAAIRAGATGRRIRTLLLGGIILAGVLAVGLTAVRFLGWEYPAQKSRQNMIALEHVLSGNKTISPDSHHFRTLDANGDGRLDSADLALFQARAAKTGTASPEDQLAGIPGPQDGLLERWIIRLRAVVETPGRSIRDRLRLLDACWRIWESHPFWGVGPGNLEPLIDDFFIGADNPTLMRTHAHNLPLQLLAELGVPGFAAYWLLLAAVLVTLWRRFRRGGPGVQADFYLGWAVVAVLIHHLVDITILYIPMKYIFPFLTGIFFSGVAGRGSAVGED